MTIDKKPITTAPNPRTDLCTDTRGLSTVEYLILLVLIAVAGIATWKSIGGEVTAKGNAAAKSLKGLK